MAEMQRHRDERWEKVWGYVGTPEYDILDPQPDEYYKANVEYRFEVDYEGVHHWLVMRVHKDERRAEPRFDQKLLDRMVERMDEAIALDVLVHPVTQHRRDFPGHSSGELDDGTMYCVDCDWKGEDDA